MGLGVRGWGCVGGRMELNEWFAVVGEQRMGPPTEGLQRKSWVFKVWF